jgi:simple sugar transport system permease protein
MSLIDASILAVIIRVTAPILLATIGALFSEKAGVPNITLEPAMLLGAFFGVFGSYYTGSSVLGAVSAVAAGLLVALIFALFTLKWGGDEIVVGVAINVIMGGLTIFLLKIIFHTSGSFMSPEIIGFPQLDIPLLDRIPVLKYLFAGQTWVVYFAFLSVWIAHVLLYKTPFGMKIIACGENPLAAATVGVNVYRIRLYALLITGGLCGLAGSQISLGFLSMFSENMTAGRGFIAVAAVIFARAVPVRVLFISLLFGLAEALSNQLQLLKFPSELVLMLPYLLVVLFLVIQPDRFRWKKWKSAGAVSESGA